MLEVGELTESSPFATYIYGAQGFFVFLADW